MGKCRCDSNQERKNGAVLMPDGNEGANEAPWEIKKLGGYWLVEHQPHKARKSGFNFNPRVLEIYWGLAFYPRT